MITLPHGLALAFVVVVMVAPCAFTAVLLVRAQVSLFLWRRTALNLLDLIRAAERRADRNASRLGIVEGTTSARWRFHQGRLAYIEQQASGLVEAALTGAHAQVHE